MITEPFWKISEKIVETEKNWDSKLNPRNAKAFSLVTLLENDN